MRRDWATLCAALTLIVGACSSGDEAAEPAAVEPSAEQVVAGEGVEVTVEPGPNSVLTALVTVRTDQPVRPRLTATSDDHVVEVPAPRRAQRQVELALVGLRAEQAYELRLAGSPAVAALDPVTFETGSLPDDLPAVETTVGGEPRPGFTLFNATPSDLSIEHPGNLIAVDDEGEVVWYHQDGQMISDVRQLPDGDLLYNFGNIGARRVDVLGRLVTDWTTRRRVAVGQRDRFGHETFTDDAVVLDTPRLHHEVSVPLPNGNWLALSQEVRTFRGFTDPGCPDDPFPDPTVRPQRGDVVVEYAPDGRIVHQVALLDAIDPRRQPGSQQCNVKTDEVANGEDPFVDWSHANSATLFEDDNAVLVSARNLDSVMALRWRDDASGPAGEVLWQFGPDLDFALTEGEWFHRQHAPEVQADGSILLYDNSVGRDKAPPASRAVRYELDRSGPRGTWTARQVWEHRLDGSDGPVFAEFLGDADAIGDGHVLVTHGAVVDRSVDQLTALLVEVDEATGEVLLRIEVPWREGRGTALQGLQTYRAEHLDTWYPRVTDPAALDDVAGDPPLP